MSESDNFNPDSATSIHDGAQAGSSPPATHARATSGPEPDPSTLSRVLPFDPVRLLVAILRGGWKILGSATLLAAIAGGGGWFRFDTHHTATVQLIRRELPNSFRASSLGESFKPRQLSTPTITAMMRTPGLLQKVGAQADPRQSARGMLRNLTITPEKNTDLITVTLQGQQGAEATATLLNLYAEEVVALTQTLQSQEASELNDFLKDQITKIERELTSANEAMLNFSLEAKFYSAEREVESYLRELKEAEVGIHTARLEAESLEYRIAAIEAELGRQDPIKLKLAAARERLNALLVHYTQANPLVMDQQAEIEALESESAVSRNDETGFQDGGNTVASSLYLDLVSFKAQLNAIEEQFTKRESYRDSVEAKLRNVPEKNLRYARMQGRKASLETTLDLLIGRQREAELFTENSLGYYRLFAAATVGQVTESSRGKKVILVTVAGFLLGGGIALLGLCYREILDDRLLSPGDLRRITGVPLIAKVGDLCAMSDTESATWRFCTWAVIQRKLALSSDSGLALGIISAGSGEGRSTWVHELQLAAAERGWKTIVVANTCNTALKAREISMEEALSSPENVTREIETDSHVALITAPSWEWNVAHRESWRKALRRWGNEPHLAVLVEIPPANRLNSILLAETLPHLFWLSESGERRQKDVKPLVETIRLAQVNLKGAFLNRLTGPLARLPDLGRFGLMFMAGLTCITTGEIRAQEQPDSTPETTTYFSASASGPNLASWQERFTLGPGDVLNLSVYGDKSLTRKEVPIGPDGRLSYLQIQGLMAAGLTIDELRESLDLELSRYYKNARVIVSPFAFRSKKYYLLGTVMDRGAYYLDRPTTIIEAIAKARGLATGLLDQNTVEIADLQRTILIRNHQRFPVDFEKLFQQGDLSQNILLEPGDYIYFPSTTLNEVYVLGSVQGPGTVGLTYRASLLGVITTRGGFAPSAYKKRVLVIRGSLNAPQTFIVDVAGILAGREVDFLLQPKDIIFVSDRPWTFVEELLDNAIQAFAVTATTTWVNKNVAPLIVEPLIPE